MVKLTRLKQHWHIVAIIIVFVVIMLLVSWWFNKRIEHIESDIDPFS